MRQADSGEQSWAVRPIHGALFDELSNDQCAAIARLCVWRNYPAGSQILNRDDGGSDVYFVQSGRVRATAYSPDGRAVTYRDIPAGQAVGDFAALDGLPRSADVVALDDVRLASLDRQHFLQLLEEHPVMMRAQLRSLTAVIRGLTDRLYDASTLNANMRIRAWLLRAARVAGVSASGEAVLRGLPSQSEIAHRVGAQRETVSREFSRLQRAGIIRKAGNGVLSVEVATLESALDQ